MDALSDEPYNPTSGSPTPASDPRKLVNFLETTATNLSTAFKVWVNRFKCVSPLT